MFHASMFHVYLIAYRIFKDHSGRMVHFCSKDVLDCLPVDDPMEVVQLFHEAPDDSVMFVYDKHGNSYRFSKGELLKSEEDTDIDLFTWYYV